MLKIVLKNERIAKYILKINAIKKLFVIHIEYLNQIYDHEVYEHGLYSILLNNYTSKTTKFRRFKDIESDSLNFIDDNYVIHDIGVSSGITSLDFYKEISVNYKNIDFYISDKYSHFYTSGRFIKSVFDVDMKLIHIYIWNILADKKLPLKYIISKYLSFVELFIKNKNDNHKKVSIFHNKIFDEIKKGNIKEIEYDIFNTIISNKFNFVRVMNLLNLAYFSEQRLLIALKNISLSIKNGGILLIGRTDKNGINNASFFEKQQNRFKLIKRINNGTEIQKLVLNI